ncbi:MAG: glycosyltransferase family 4 protein [Candidatus Omnitrophica bacterium]|nr:glycosyltransferase family 4 protein [Candidatus Omnitrophota bacterium]
MEKIKVAQIITKLELGGAQKTTLSLLRHIDRKRYCPYLITASGGYLKEEASSISQLNILFLDTLLRDVNIFKDLVSFFKIRRYLKQQGISIVHTHSSKAGIIGRWAAHCAGVKLIFHTVHGWPFYIEAKTTLKLAYKVLEKITALITTRLVVVSDEDLKEGLRAVNKSRDKYIKIPYGIEIKDFTVKMNYGAGGEIVKVGFIACYKPQKAPMDFLKVVKKVAGAEKYIEFISAGDGILRPEVMREAARLGLDRRIKFLGWQPNIAAVLEKLDIVLLTSHWEGLPVVIIESLASGIPVVATEVGGVPELVIDGINGFLAAKGDCEKLADGVLSLAADKEKRLQFSRQSRKRFKEKFNIDYMKNRVESLYQRAKGG